MRAAGAPAPGGEAGRALSAVAPHALLVAAFLAFRFLLLPSVAASPVYRPSPGLHVLRNGATVAAEAFGGPLVLVAVVALAAAWWTSSAASTGGARRRLARSSALLGAWLGVAVAPFALLPFAQPRYAMLAAAPAALLCGVLAQAVWETAGRRSPRRVEAAFVAAVWLALPYGVLLERFSDPRGAAPRGLVQAVESRRAALPARARVVVLYGGPGLAPADLAMGYRYLAYNGAVLKAVHPEWELSLRFHDLSERAPRHVIRPGTVYLELRPDLEIGDADAARLERELARGTEPTHG